MISIILQLINWGEITNIYSKTKNRYENIDVRKLLWPVGIQKKLTYGRYHLSCLAVTESFKNKWQKLKLKPSENYIHSILKKREKHFERNYSISCT